MHQTGAVALARRASKGMLGYRIPIIWPWWISATVSFFVYLPDAIHVSWTAGFPVHPESHVGGECQREDLQLAHSQLQTGFSVALLHLSSGFLYPEFIWVPRLIPAFIESDRCLPSFA